ncbi:glycoside hydrolase family 1 protein [Streptomyces termitum]|uniref:beta-glucosidase n=1 Tax=Streptomyces termitum TaxID=67368 RepID=A0A918T4H6_9ACTN|nr:family 1 glycosylhydrolase [Streptomyces termitum]GHA91852.1 beta-glucosidase [Streptomyces termitum]
MSDPRTTLPEGFLWGASTAAHQTEGANHNSDWWELEHLALEHGIGHIEEPSGDACDSFHRWPEDMDLLAALGFTDYRFSIEWARIEPAPGEISHAAIDHYRRMVEGARARGLRPMVTLNHFTTPRWFSARGSWYAEDAVDSFARFVEAAAPVYADGVEHVCTINEPNMVAALLPVLAQAAAGAPSDVLPEQLASTGLPAPDARLTEVMVRAHHRAVEVVKSHAPHVRTGWSVSVQACQALDGAKATVEAYSRPRQDVFLEAARDDDWLGIQTYTRVVVGPDGLLPVPEDTERTLTGWEFYPQALGEAVRRAAELVPGVPLVVTENGIATDDDTRRVAYTSGALAGLVDAMADGVDVHGYFHWSALDNYEWGSYRPTFGLIAVDRTTFARTPKPSASWLGTAGRDRRWPTA